MEEKNGVSKILLVIGIIEIVAGVIVGIILGNSQESFVTFIIWAAVSTTSGMLIIGFSEVINLLENNYRKTDKIHKLLINDSFGVSKQKLDSNIPIDVKKVNLLNSDAANTNTLGVGSAESFSYRFVGMGKGNHGKLSVFNPTYISLEITKGYIHVEDINNKLFDISISEIEALSNPEKNNLTIEYKDENNIARKIEVIISAEKSDKTIEKVTSIIKQLKQ